MNRPPGLGCETRSPMPLGRDRDKEVYVIFERLRRGGTCESWTGASRLPSMPR